MGIKESILFIFADSLAKWNRTLSTASGISGCPADGSTTIFRNTTKSSPFWTVLPT
jgi:hypothetical protein